MEGLKSRLFGKELFCTKIELLPKLRNLQEGDNKTENG